MHSTLLGNGKRLHWHGLFLTRPWADSSMSMMPDELYFLRLARKWAWEWYLYYWTKVHTPRLRTIDLCTALHKSAEWGSCEVVSALLKGGCLTETKTAKETLFFILLHNIITWLYATVVFTVVAFTYAYVNPSFISHTFKQVCWYTLLYTCNLKSFSMLRTWIKALCIKSYLGIDHWKTCIQTWPI